MSDRGAALPERAPAVHVALSGAAMAFVAVLLLHIEGGISEKEETRVFMLSCITVPITGIVLGAVFSALQRRFFSESTLYWPLLALANGVFWIFFVDRLRDALPPPKTGAHVAMGPVFAKHLVLWAALHVVLLAFFALTHRRRWSQSLGARLDPWVDRLLPFIVFYALLPFTMHTPPIPWKVLGLLGVSAAIASTLHGELFVLPRRRRSRIAYDLLVVIAIYLLVIDPANAHWSVRVEHHNFYLGPAAAVRAGKSVLVDVNCQYGIGNIYLLAELMRYRLMDPSMFGLAYIIGVFSFLQYVAFYASLRMATRSVGLSSLVLAVALTVATFEQVGFPAEYPSTGGIRFLPGYLFVVCIALKARFPRHVSRFVALEAFVVGMTSIWSVEAFVYVFIAYAGSLLYEIAHSRSGELRRDLGARLVPVLIAFAGWHTWLLTLTRYRSGEWPHWSYYFAYIRLYSVQEYGALPIEPWTPWLIIGGVYAAAITALGYRRLAEETVTYKPELAVVFTMAALGVGQFTYFLGRSHFNNLFHICLPAFFVAGFVFIRAAKDVDGVSRVFRRSLVLVGYAALLLCFFSGIAEAAWKFDHTLLSTWIANGTVNDAEPTRRVRDALDLLRAHADNQSRVALFSGADIDVQVFLLARKASIYPEAYQPEDDLVPAAKQRILDFDDHLKPGDIVFIDTGTKPQPNAPQSWDLADDLDTVDKDLWKKMEHRFTFDVIEERKSGPVALRLKAR